MSITIILLVLTAAILHASWNALAKSSSDPLMGIGSFRIIVALPALCIIPFVPLPASASWWAIILSTLIHTVYYFTAAGALKHGDLSQIYPIYRGLSPVLVAILSAWFAHEWLGLWQALAIGVISVGLLSLAWSPDLAGRISKTALLWGLATSVLIACYTVVDGIGVREAGNALSYIVWLFTLEAFPIGIYLMMTRRQTFSTYVQENIARCLMGGIASSVAYGLVIYAMSLSAIALVSSLRETSVIFAAIIGSLFLGEPFGRRRIIASAFVAVGIVLIRWAGSI